MYNCQSGGNPFGFKDKRPSSRGSQNIRQSAVGRSTSKRKRAKNCSSKKKLTAKNVKFLKALGLKVRNK